MFTKIKKMLNNERGALTTAELVILISIVAIIGAGLGIGLQDVFLGEKAADGTRAGGAVGELNDILEDNFKKAIDPEV